jgi:DNA topoisomerase IB
MKDTETQIANNSKMQIKRVVINPQSQKKKRFIYLDKHNDQIKDPLILDRIKKMSIPPGYTDIRISANPNNYLQAVGIDDKGRRQYIYNKSFVIRQSKNKYCYLKHFGENITKIRQDVRAILLNNKPVTDKEKMIALVIYILDKCYFRIGNIHYFNNNDSYGVSTLKSKHLMFKNKELTIEFIGKKGVLNECSVKDQLIISLLKELNLITKNTDIQKNDTEGGFIFTYLDENGKPQLIKPLDINQFLYQYHSDITLKMFRTWGANFMFLEEMIKRRKDFANIYSINTSTDLTTVTKSLKKEKVRKQIIKESDKIITEIIQKIAINLHNTPNVSRKSYLDNNLVEIYLSNPKSFWRKISYSNNKEDLNNLLVELLSFNCSTKKTTKKLQNSQRGGNLCPL